ncbi:MAG: TonB family protein [Caulobacteraceae bacterium]
MRVLSIVIGAALALANSTQSFAQTPKNDTNPDWLKKPTLDDLMAVFPSQALKQGVSGKAIIKCIVQTTGLTRACSVVKEDRPGLGFGPAAVVLSRTFLFKPAMRDGQPVEAEVTVPINFKTYGKVDDEGSVASDSGGASRIQRSTPTSTTVLGAAIWSKTPTMTRILSEIDKKVGDKFANGQVVLQCRLDKKTGKLSGCIVGNASPGMAQFSGVAKSLSADFQADPTALESFKGNLVINLAFAFPDMSSPEWSKRYLTHPTWTRTISPDVDKATFPEAAAKAGLKTGSATVDCVVRADGVLSQCEVVRESTPDVGFGEMAKRIAETFAANPWDDDGLPVDGAHVRMPVTMNYEPPADPPPPPPAPTPATKP